MYNKEFYNKKFEQIKDRIELKNNDPFNPSFHISPQIGWLNDPNGLCEFDGNYHIYYQADPFNYARKNIIWGHVKTPDFINYTYEDPFIFADSDLDKSGAYSGSAFIKDGKINFFYTGNVKHPGDFDYINEGRDHNTIKLVSEDGYSFDKKELILSHGDYPSDLTRHVRDPKVYEEDGAYYLFLGARHKNDKGKVLVFKSEDLSNFTYHMDITTNYDFGYMWECPDFFEVDGKKFLIISPQGLDSEEYKYQNIYQSGYFPIDIDLKTKEYSLGEFVELDYGFDFYAPQTFEDSKGRRILIGWMGMPDASYTNPTEDSHWQHMLSIPRELRRNKNKIVQHPIKDLENLRDDLIEVEESKEYFIDTFEFLAKNLKDNFVIKLSEDVELIYDDNVLKLSMGKSGFGRDIRKIKIENIDNIRIYKDTSSLEIFINDGEYSITSRSYSKNSYFKSSIEGTLYTLKTINID